MVRSQTRTGKSEGFDKSGVEAVGRCGSVDGPARNRMVSADPSAISCGHCPDIVIARATGSPPSPSTTKVASGPGICACGGAACATEAVSKVAMAAPSSAMHLDL